MPVHTKGLKEVVVSMKSHLRCGCPVSVDITTMLGGVPPRVVQWSCLAAEIVQLKTITQDMGHTFLICSLLPLFLCNVTMPTKTRLM